jgi:hypothetical protein
MNWRTQLERDKMVTHCSGQGFDCFRLFLHLFRNCSSTVISSRIAARTVNLSTSTGCSLRPNRGATASWEKIAKIDQTNY